MEVTITRDSVCMADDVDAPHEQKFVVPNGATLAQLASVVARTSYLPMPSDAWGWTIEVEEALFAIRKGFLRRRVVALQGIPAMIVLTDNSELLALYVRPDSRWRDLPGH